MRITKFNYLVITVYFPLLLGEGKGEVIGFMAHLLHGDLIPPFSYKEKEY